MSLGSFLDYASAQGKVLKTISGVIIYPEDSTIPQDVIIVPYEAKKGEALDTIVINAFSQLNCRGIFTYFQSIRWTVPELEREIKAWKYINGFTKSYNYFPDDKIKISYGKVTFDQTYVYMEPEEEPKIGHLNLEALQQQFEVDIDEYPRELGVPKLFEKINP